MNSAPYPTPQEAVAIAATESLMEETMKNFDPSHDAYHGSRVSSSTCVFLVPH